MAYTLFNPIDHPPGSEFILLETWFNGYVPYGTKLIIRGYLGTHAVVEPLCEIPETIIDDRFSGPKHGYPHCFRASGGNVRSIEPNDGIRYRARIAEKRGHLIN